MEFPTIDKFAKEVAEKALDEITYDGKTIREWVEIIVNQQQSEDCRNCKKWNKCPCGKEGHENGTSIGYSIGECKDYEPCEDCISRQAVSEYITANYGFCHNLIDWVKDLPSVTPKAKVGQWIYTPKRRLIDETDEGGVYITDYRCTCSECGGDFGFQKMSDAYCKYCGAEMSRGGEE